MAIELTDLVCVVTGAGEGVGRGLVRGFLQRGARVVAAVRNLEKSAAMVSPAHAVQLDVTKAEDVRSAVEELVSKYGRIDVWINNAGIYPRQSVDEITFADWRQVLDTNLDGAWRCCEALIPQLKRQGSGVIINVGSIVLRLGGAQLTHYLASKGGLVGMTRGLARDLGPHGIRVNCVHLGAVRTEGESRSFPDEQAVLARIEQNQALRGRMTPETVEPVFAFLASAESSDVTGQCLTVDRGWTHD
jgi:NAD(P)-dependent dehydrogenase (short-subunit alcohol dehydrogenase family)